MSGALLALECVAGNLTCFVVCAMCSALNHKLFLPTCNIRCPQLQTLEIGMAALPSDKNTLLPLLATNMLLQVTTARHACYYSSSKNLERRPA